MIVPKKTVCDFCGRKVGINCRYYIIKSKNEHVGLTRYTDNQKHHVCYLCYADLQKCMRKMIQTRQDKKGGKS